MKKLITALVVMSLFLVAGNAFAITIADIDGTDSGEWVDLLVSAEDPNEATIANDDYDIWKVGMIAENNGDFNDGLYIGFMLYGTPTLDLYPGETGGSLPFYRTILDLDMNGIEDGNDRRIDFEKIGGTPTLTVYDSSLTTVAGTPTYGMGSVVEWFIPKSMFVNFPLGGFQTFARLDNGGLSPEDSIPDEGWSTSVPEPSSMILLGMGLFGFVGGVIRKKFTA